MHGGAGTNARHVGDSKEMRRFLRGGAAVGMLAWCALAAHAQTCSPICLSTPPILPSGTVNTSYSTALGNITMGGNPPYTYTSPVVPPGLGMNSSGLISGIPTSATTGYFTGSVTVTDSSNPPQTASGLAFYLQV